MKSLIKHPLPGVCACLSETDMTIAFAVITGPFDTPYEGGFFLFKFNFPNDYPNTPPKVKLLTTGGGRVRFNPNLYSNGKVCLSLLGTWSGRAGEMWSAETSNLLQVLISIQGLVLVQDPYFNEPGYEAERGSARGAAWSPRTERRKDHHQGHRARGADDDEQAGDIRDARGEQASA